MLTLKMVSGSGTCLAFPLDEAAEIEEESEQNGKTNQPSHNWLNVQIKNCNCNRFYGLCIF